MKWIGWGLVGLTGLGGAGTTAASYAYAQQGWGYAGYEDWSYEGFDSRVTPNPSMRGRSRPGGLHGGK